MWGGWGSAGFCVCVSLLGGAGALVAVRSGARAGAGGRAFAGGLSAFAGGLSALAGGLLALAGG